MYTSADVVGVELAGGIKNVIALAAGVAVGYGAGHNTQAALVSRGLAEMMSLGSAVGAKPETFAGLAGMGDLLVTCFSDQSRNRSVGIEIGRGHSVRPGHRRNQAGGRRGRSCCCGGGAG